jgi:hypothetical protein
MELSIFLFESVEALSSCSITDAVPTELIVFVKRLRELVLVVVVVII